MKLILSDKTEFQISYANVYQDKIVEEEEQNTDKNLRRIDITFMPDVTFDEVAALDETLYSDITIVSTASTQTFTGYAYSSLHQMLSDASDRLTLSLKK